MKAPFIRSPFNYDVKAASDSTSVEPGPEPSLTVQSMSEEADINVMMKRYGITGKMPESPYVPQYGDFSQVQDFRTGLMAIQAASEQFMLYPADFRARFDNDPQLFLEFCENPANRPEMAKLGLLRASQEAPGAPISPPPATTAPPSTPPPTEPPKGSTA